MSHKPLHRIRVLEIGGYIAAPYAASLLRSLGADVVKVERPDGGDAFRRDVDHRSPYFMQYNAGKRSLAVDLKSSEGVALVKALLPRFDVLIENVRPGKLDALGLGAEHCKEINPRLVYASVTGFGNGGPLRDRAAYDTIGQAMGGLYTVMSKKDEVGLTGTCVADLITGLGTATGVLAALVGRGSDDEGAHVETSMLESVSALTIDAMTQMYDTGGIDPVNGSRHPQAQNFCLQTASDRQIAVHLSSSQKFWRALLRAIGRDELATDPRFVDYRRRMDHYAELVEIVQAEFLTRTADEWEKLLIEADVPFAPVVGLSELAVHPQTRWLNMIEPADDEIGLVGAPWRFGGERPDRGGHTPRVGEHTREVAGEVLDRATVDRLIAHGTLFAL